MRRSARGPPRLGGRAQRERGGYVNGASGEREWSVKHAQKCVSAERPRTLQGRISDAPFTYRGRSSHAPFTYRGRSLDAPFTYRGRISKIGLRSADAPRGIRDAPFALDFIFETLRARSIASRATHFFGTSTLLSRSTARARRSVTSVPCTRTTTATPVRSKLREIGAARSLLSEGRRIRASSFRSPLFMRRILRASRVRTWPPKRS